MDVGRQGAAGSTGFSDWLGPAEFRYFGLGYRRVLYEFTGVGHVDDALVGCAAVAYPSSWSAKRATERAAHLSTLDALVIAVYAIAHTLSTGMGLPRDSVGRAWLEAVTIRAGGRPQMHLDALQFRCATVASEPAQNGVRTTFTISVSAFTVRAVVRHEVPSDAPRIDEFPGPAPCEGPYGTGFRVVRHQADVVTVDAEARFLECDLAVSTPAHEPIGGLESAYARQPSLIDCLVLAGQMAEVLLQAIDRQDREAAGALWMRRISFASSSPRRPSRGRAHLTVGERQSIRSPGGIIHGFDAECRDLLGVHMTAKLAYAETWGDTAS